MEGINPMIQKKMITPLVIAIVVMCWTVSAWSAGDVSLKIKPNEIHIDTLFNGSVVTLTGELPADQDIIVEIAGPVENAMFDMKGQFGPFWMNRDKLEIENAPNLYGLLLPDRPALKQDMHQIGLGWETIKNRIMIEPAALGLDAIFDMFIALKESEGLYNENLGAVTYGQVHDGMKTFTADFPFPSSTSVGEFQVTATSVKNGQRVQQVSHDLTVKETGFIKFIHRLAFDNSLIYGVFSVLIALMAGAVMGVMFKSGGAH